MSADATPTPPVRRSTRGRQVLSQVLAGQPGFRTAQELHTMLRTRGEAIGLATVYRSLQAMLADQEVDVIRTPEGENAYRRCTVSHHHHLICRSCGLVIEVQAEGFEDWASGVASLHGFSDPAHLVEIYGLCANCRAAAAGSDEFALDQRQ